MEASCLLIPSRSLSWRRSNCVIKTMRSQRTSRIQSIAWMKSLNKYKRRRAEIWVQSSKKQWILWLRKSQSSDLSKHSSNLEVPNLRIRSTKLVERLTETIQEQSLLMNGSQFQHRLRKRTPRQVKLKLTTILKMKSGHSGSSRRTNLSKLRYFSQRCSLN